MHYEIRVKGVLDAHWSAWFEGLELRAEGATTVISGPIPDQAALHEALAKSATSAFPSWPCLRSTATHQMRGSDLDAHRLKGIRWNDQAPATGPLAAAVPTS
jgi:hypothetical protein